MFTWDEAKRKSNLAKHGIDFRDGAAIFEGPLVTVEDTREDYGEPRYVFSRASSYRSCTPSAMIKFD